MNRDKNPDNELMPATTRAETPTLPFPNLVWETVKETPTRQIRDDEIDAEGLEQLISMMWEEPEVRYFVFWPTHRGLASGIANAVSSRRLQMLEFESRWYLRPNADHFIRIEEPKHDWHKAVVQTVMYYRGELKLSAAEARRLDTTAQRNTIQETMNAASPSYRLGFVNRAVSHFHRHQSAYGLAGAVMAILGLILTFL